MAARPLRVGYGMSFQRTRNMLSRLPYLVHEHFSSPILTFAAEDQGKTFTLTACPGACTIFPPCCRNRLNTPQVERGSSLQRF